MKQILVDFFNLIGGIFSSFFSNFWKWFHFGLFAGTLVLFLTIVSNRTIIDFSESFVFDSHENIPKNEVSILTNVQNASQLINMDQNIFLHHKGKYYIIKGRYRFGTDSFKSNELDKLKERANVR